MSIIVDFVDLILHHSQDPVSRWSRRLTERFMYVMMLRHENSNASHACMHGIFIDRW